MVGLRLLAVEPKRLVAVDSEHSVGRRNNGVVRVRDQTTVEATIEMSARGIESRLSGAVLLLEELEIDHVTNLGVDAVGVVEDLAIRSAELNVDDCAGCVGVRAVIVRWRRRWRRNWRSAGLVCSSSDSGCRRDAVVDRDVNNNDADLDRSLILVDVAVTVLLAGARSVDIDSLVWDGYLRSISGSSLALLTRNLP